MKYLSSSTQNAQILLILNIIATVVGIGVYGLSWGALGLFVLGYFLYGCLGIVVTVHRYWTHQSYTANPWLIKLFSFLACLGGTGSPLAWVAIHINHHLKSDTEGDPHSPLYKGLSIFSLKYDKEVDSKTRWRMRRMIGDTYQRILHQYYMAILLSWGVLLYAIGGWYLVVFLFMAPAFCTAVMSNVVNYIGHKPGWFGSYRRFNLNDRSVNNWVWSIFSWGETWHNNHHRYPRRFSTSQVWWEIDISGLLIQLIRRRPTDT
jgi:fatty-acid desaturase